MEMPHENRLDWTVLMRDVKVSIDQQGRSSPNLPVTVPYGAQTDEIKGKYREQLSDKSVYM